MTSTSASRASRRGSPKRKAEPIGAPSASGGSTLRAWLVIVASSLAASAISGCGGGKVQKVDSFPDRFVGVGLELRIEDDEPIVVRALSGGSAESAGMAAGDRVVAVDGKPTRGLSLGSVVMLIRGEPGSQVNLTVARDSTQMLVVVPRRAMVKQNDAYTAQQQ